MSEKEVCRCCRKTTDRSEEECKRLIHRLNRNKGQIRGICKMAEKAVSDLSLRLCRI
ncbi:MAG: metal-sensing transcriptional repressor [Clostridia bacterium]|nr:metal-sensing transcriptional repressor [Clostridia bacterium]